jgi:hypothetical protein
MIPQNSELPTLLTLMQKEKFSQKEGFEFFLLRNKYHDVYLDFLKIINPLAYQVFLEEQEVLTKPHLVVDFNSHWQQQIVEQEKKDYFHWLESKKRA